MQKISSYLLKNRIQLVADLAAFSTEWTIVYQRQVKIYKGIDNTLEFDIKNADQKRIETRDEDLEAIPPIVPEVTEVQVNIMDHNGYALPNSPYLASTTAIKGIVTIVLPKEDLENLEDQFLTFSVTATKNSADVLLYADTRFSSSGTIELLSNTMPKTMAIQTYDDFYGVGDFNNTTITYTSSSVPLKFRNATPPTLAEIVVSLDDLDGIVWVEATKDTVIGNESFTYKGTKLLNQTVVPANTSHTFSDIDISEYTFLRVCYTKDPKVTTGSISSFTIEFYNS